jgi:hypothetical protein
VLRFQILINFIRTVRRIVLQNDNNFKSGIRFLRKGAEHATLGLEFILTSSPKEYNQNVAPFYGDGYPFLAKEKLLDPDLTYKISFLLDFKYNLNKYDQYEWYIDKFNILFSGEKFIEFNAEGEIAKFKIHQNRHTFFDFTKNELKVFSHPNHTLNYPLDNYYFKPFTIDHFTNIEYAADKDFLNLFFGIVAVCLNRTYGQLGVNSEANWVPASRQIPKPEECVFLADEIDGYKTEFINNIPIQNLNKSKRFFFVLLIRSFYAIIVKPIKQK